MVPTFLVRGRDGVNELILTPPLTGLAGHDERERLQGAIQTIARRLERYVIEHPCHYLPFLALRHMTAVHEGEPPLLLDAAHLDICGDPSR